MLADGAAVELRAFQEGDRAGVVRLSQRLTAGVAPWRDSAAVASVISGCVADSLDQRSLERPVYVAFSGGRVLGFVTATTRRHWSGDVDAYVGELAVDAESTGHGVGRMLMAAAEGWACDRGQLRLTLETGAGNTAAQGFYRALGYDLEEIVLSRDLTSSDHRLKPRARRCCAHPLESSAVVSVTSRR